MKYYYLKKNKGTLNEYKKKIKYLYHKQISSLIFNFLKTNNKKNAYLDIGWKSKHCW